MAEDTGKKFCNEDESPSFRRPIARRDFPPGCGPQGHDAVTCQYTPAEETKLSEDSSSLSLTKTRSRSRSMSRSMSRSRSSSRVLLGIRSMVGRGALIRHTARKRVRPGTLFRMGTTSGVPAPTTPATTPPTAPTMSSSYRAATRGPYPRSGPTPSETSEERAERIYREYVLVALQVQESQERVNGLLEALRIIDSLIATILGMRHP
ncbi:hypothetical protein L1987_23237 [Smallanthus sonchifolius]|uniref:Uncharacterized protein n=1 Tax=Smallanthus sonchifolius TaxID=185202 RepID=A0ACB9IIJ6_9ASTR|nr:hypothetical protein L1987_23237 [Smallanthus sonchifolius]